jgi:secreted trypsin-like serine protease
MHGIPKLIFGALVAAAFSAPAYAAMSGDYITSGRVASENSWPWQVRLLDSMDPQTGFCGGSLITDQWVLTAAHCLLKDDQVIDSVVVGYGSTYQSKLTMVASAKIFVHPDYLNGEATDVGLIKLESPIPDAAWIEIANEATDSKLLKPGVKLTVTGWGSLWDFTGFEASASIRNGHKMASPRALLSGGELQSPDQLREVDIQMIDSDECKQSYEAFGDAIEKTGYTIAPTEICAGSPEGAKDSCYGDSGGPLVTPADNAQGYVQVGIVSWGVQCGNPALPGVYTRISQLYGWIKDTVVNN